MGIAVFYTYHISFSKMGFPFIFEKTGNKAMPANTGVIP